jgi:phosphatidylserine decarboxylase
MKNTSQSLLIWDRKSQAEGVEKVYGDQGIRFLYGTRFGRWLATTFLARPWLSRLVGWYHSSQWSQKKIDRFIKAYAIPMQEFEETGYRSFNDFFIRKFKESERPFVSELEKMPAVAEGRYLAFKKMSSAHVYPVKGDYLSAQQILGNHSYTREFEGGPLLIARLCPTDYHRFHYPDHGKTLDYYRVPGLYHSVNPVALKAYDTIFSGNERRVSIIETENLGRLAYVEVGAMCVGRIVQSHSPDLAFSRGDEKGYFLFGGSTVIIFGQPGRWEPERDLLEQTARQRETLVRLGEPVARVL